MSTLFTSTLAYLNKSQLLDNIFLAFKCLGNVHFLARSTVISVIMPPPLDVKGGIITEKVFPVFSESFFWTCFGLVMYIWELMGVTEKFAFQM